MGSDEQTWTVCVLATRNADGTVTMLYSAPIGATQAALIGLMAGPVVAEQVLSAEEIATHSLLPNGVIIAHDGVSP